MANMSVNQRVQYERVDLSVPTTGVRVKNRKVLVTFTALAVAVLGVLSYAAIELIDGWARALVLAMIFVIVIGAMIALSPNRRA